jgi:DNA-binding CsgD family transcriptional regulator
MVSSSSSHRDARGCTPIGSLEQFVQRIDEGPAARSLHLLSGHLHSAVGRESDLLQWVVAVRERFDAVQALTFECDFSTGRPRRLVCDPADSSLCTPAIEAMRDALRGRQVGEAVLYGSAPAEGTPEGRRVSAAAVVCSASSVIGVAMARPADAVGDERAVLQYLAAITWHLKCADNAAAEVQALSMRPSPTDLVDMLPMACVLTDPQGRSIDRNEAFVAFMSAAGMRISTGRLQFEDSYLQDSWHVALNEVHLTAVPQSLLVAGVEGDQWRVHLVPMRCALEAGDTTERALILVMVEHIAVGAEIAMDRVLHEESRPLTPAENEVLSALLQGHSAKVIANARGASVNTVRSQIMTILDKTGHHNQKSLIAAFAPSGFRTSMLPGYNSGMARVSRSARR